MSVTNKTTPSLLTRRFAHKTKEIKPCECCSSSQCWHVETVQTKLQRKQILDDADNDGYDSSIDCDDDNPAIHPGSTEICDGIDNDCDGNIDDGVLVSFFEDSDGDGFGNPIESTMACEVPEGFVTNGSDCDDNEPDAYPGNVESCDGIDNDCNDSIDDGLGDSFYIDSDRDGFGDDSNTQLACSLQDGLSVIGGDCNDNGQALILASEPVTKSTTTVMKWMRRHPNFLPRSG